MHGIFKRVLLTLDIAWYLIVVIGILHLTLVSTIPLRWEYELLTAADIESSEHLRANNIEAGDYLEIIQNFPKKEYGSIVKAESMPLFHLSSFMHRLFDNEVVYSFLGLLGYILARWIILGTAVPLRSSTKITSPTQ